MPTREQIVDFSEPITPPEASPWVVQPVAAVIEVVPYDPTWPQQAELVRARVLGALGQRAVRLEHVGSTAVPGLAAKAVIDLDLTVADPSDERVWLPRLEAAGFVLTVREPWWRQHRLLRAGAGAPGVDAGFPDGQPAVNLHVFGPDSPELVKHVVFRDWLRASARDRELYASIKRAAADGPGQRVMDYNARKEAVVHEIYQRALQAAGFFDDAI
ncbi:GrpB family protein [Streptomyces sp. NP160]|uniref:GrpB family protein n=1 Tax=Streptomyces sp. NP160 TaxID=2586637 RepID=UPI001118E7E7|nr:GrpB family protein [Streptomyces sp. NP160]TNM67611.1 GrpB family protein [Streptomyces sp. NP160]